ncbi:AbrB/MazE/SpoVT family DNA-binding domain-containing protein [Blastomonas sp.]|uniref:AbrB/MazE/SpoVT family DNA-binding domain-containing protein n=1 Tax=Blastomonas sp. TaxID=1909299 RepID=UPI0035932621
MQIAKWGNSLAVRLPADLVRELGLKEGDQIDLYKDGTTFKVSRHPRAEDILADLHRFRGRLPSSGRLSRDTAHER